MSRDGIEPATSAALGRRALTPIALVYLDFESGPFRMFTGFGRLNWDGHVWYGAGMLGEIGQIEETIETRAAGVELRLSGVKNNVIAIALNENWQGREARIWYAVLDLNDRFVGQPFQIRRGVMDVMILEEGDKAQITLKVESRDIDLGRNRIRRYTPEDQRAEYPGDRGCDQVPFLQNKDILWSVR